MPVPRLFQPIPLEAGTTILLNKEASHHIAHVLRAALNDTVIVFNGKGGEYHGIMTEIHKKGVQVQLKEFIPREVESPLELYLAQGISRGEKMDYTIQKAVELGVKKIIPLLTARCGVNLDKERTEKRLMHWRSIIISACEQSGRNRIPDILPPEHFQTYLQTLKADKRFILSPYAIEPLKNIPRLSGESTVLLVGPEGGFSESEVKEALEHDFLSFNLGPRILRTETAAVAAVTALQCYLGDM